jgi:N-acetylmuramoyl-L-alanine amidase
MSSFISAGHHLKDSGAIGSGTQENLETIGFRNLVVPICKQRGLKVFVDDDKDSLATYLSKIKTGDGSVIVEFHFDAFDGKATVSTAIVGVDADENDKAFAKELVDTTASILGIKNRGVISEAKSRRKSLALMRKTGIVSLLEICFIDNPSDMAKYNQNKIKLANEIAAIIDKYDKLI